MEAKIKEIIKKTFKTKVEKIERIKEGYSHKNYLVRLSQQPHEVIIRFDNQKRKWSCLEKEKFVIELLRKHEIPAPKIYAHCFKGEQLENNYLVLESINGDRLDLIWSSLSKDEKIKITEKIGRLSSDMHKIKFDKFGSLGPSGEIDNNIGFKFQSYGKEKKVNSNLRKILENEMESLASLASRGNFSVDLIQKYFNWVMSKREILKGDGQPCFNHGDFFPGHIFVKKIKNEWKIVGLIDFEFACAFNLEKDFIKLDRSGFFDIPGLKEALEKGYGKSIDAKKVRVHRIMRDFAFAIFIRESGGNELADKKFEEIENLIDKENATKKMEFFKFP